MKTTLVAGLMIIVAGCQHNERHDRPSVVDNPAKQNSSHERVHNRSGVDASTGNVMHQLINDAPFYNSAPQQASTSDGIFPSGTKARFIEDAGDYALVESQSGVMGYVSKNDLDMTKSTPAKTNLAATQITHTVHAETPYYESGPQQARAPDGVLAAGTKLRVIDSAGSYARVMTESGIEGYVSEDDLDKISE